MKILLVEDNKTNQLILSALLAPAGIELTIVENGRAAVDAYAREQFDLILMDIQMPEMNGLEATRQIRASEREVGRRGVPVLALSANVMAHQVAEYKAAGMDGVVAKPIEATKLFASIDEAIAGGSEPSHTSASEMRYGADIPRRGHGLIG